MKLGGRAATIVVLVLLAPGADAQTDACAGLESGAYCIEDGDPCTVDFCRNATCVHEPDGSGERCADLRVPFAAAVALRDGTLALRTAIALCATADGPACGASPASDEIGRLVALLDDVRTGLDAVIVGVAGRNAPGPGPDPARDVGTRAEAAVERIGVTLPAARAFLTMLARARRQHRLEPAYARARRADGRHLLRGLIKVRRELHALVVRQLSFVKGERPRTSPRTPPSG
jgi:hypothetical protein